MAACERLLRASVCRQTRSILPNFKRVCQHQQFGLGIGCGANGFVREPRVADFADVGILAAVARMACGPCPAVDIKKARGTDDDAVRDANSGEGQRGAGFAQCKCCINVAKNRVATDGHGAPLVKRGIARRCSDKSVRVSRRQRLKTNMAAGKGWRVEGHVFL